MLVFAQGSFPPQAGVNGTTAIPADSSCFRDWAISCQVEWGLLDIGDSTLGFASGSEVNGTGQPDQPAIISLGDGGSATLQFSGSIYDGEGFDFAVFENGFGFEADAFLEFAFVEASSDGIVFFRFPAISEVQDSIQTGSFEYTDASDVHNLAGKYVANYGTPFDLADLPDTSLLDKSAITHIRIIDVIGSIDSAYAQYDSEGNIINDPWPTPFSSSGFDLDAVGVIHSNIPLSLDEIHALDQQEEVHWMDVLGRPVNAYSTGLQISSRGKRFVSP